MPDLHDAPSVPVATSEDAAAAMTEKCRTFLHRRLLATLEGGRFCSRELAQLHDLDENTVRPRLWELELAGMIVKLDGKDGRETVKKYPNGQRSGMYAYEITRKGAEHWQALRIAERQGRAHA